MQTGIGRGLGIGLWMASLVAAGAVAARADVSVDEGATILMYPKVINAGGRDTIIQMTNSGNTLLHVHCYYTDARPRNPSAPPGPTNPPLWQEVDFFLWLTRQQPTAWVASLQARRTAGGTWVDATASGGNVGGKNTSATHTMSASARGGRPARCKSSRASSAP